jgi:hypothetical protein
MPILIILVLLYSLSHVFLYVYSLFSLSLIRGVTLGLLFAIIVIVGRKEKVLPSRINPRVDED